MQNGERRRRRKYAPKMKQAFGVGCLMAGLLFFGGPGCRRSQSGTLTTRPDHSQLAQPILEIDAYGERDSSFRIATSGKSPDYRILVFDDGAVQYRISGWKSCSPNCPNYGWLYRWDDSREQIFTGKVERTEMDRLKALLDREAKGLEGYANQGPQVGDYQILVCSTNGQPSGSVVFGLQPAWGISRPYVDLICEGKNIAHGLTSSASIPDWCSKSN